MLKGSVIMLGDMIKKRREQIGMSQDELAQKVGYKSRSSINKIELNKQDLTQSQVTKIANALNVPVGYLLGDKIETPKSTNSLSIDEQSLIEKYRQLKEDGKEMVNMVLNREFQFLEYRRKMESIKNNE